MKRLILAALLIPFLINGQEPTPSTIFTNVMLTAHPTKIAEFEAGLAAHNKKYHADGPYQASVFWIASGKNSGKYIWSMGPNTWASMDDAPANDPEHTADWNTNVVAHAMPDQETTYWRSDMKHSNFSKDFSLKNLSIFMIDIKRFKQMEFEAVLDKVTKVYKEKDPEQQWGVYFNEMNNVDGKDFVWVNFFDKSAWLGKDDKFPQYFEEVHGEGSFPQFLKDFEAATDGQQSEFWIFRGDLSGANGEVQAVNGQ
ncbi:hypothetical protein WIW50_19940 [Flavobacteriaceae bacterium 3-367]|uniref:hypothetical protein n=1 Tax=Eudoraea algarum TaxID=3417568 RepID=UPI00326E736A